jgi:hypothetical protein
MKEADMKVDKKSMAFLSAALQRSCFHERSRYES